MRTPGSKNSFPLGGSECHGNNQEVREDAGWFFYPRYSFGKEKMNRILQEERLHLDPTRRGSNESIGSRA